MAKTTYLVTIDDSPTLNYGHDDRIEVTLHEAKFYIVPEAVGRKIATVSVPDSKRIAAGAATVFAAVFGNPPEKPPLRDVREFVRDGIDATLAGRSTPSPRRIDRTGGA